MTYLLTLGWPWFASAAALGALVGFFTYRLDKNTRFSAPAALLPASDCCTDALR
jgi:hypothetical protein